MRNRDGNKKKGISEGRVIEKEVQDRRHNIDISAGESLRNKYEKRERARYRWERNSSEQVF